MDADMRSEFLEIKKSIGEGHAVLNGKMDLANQQFNEHLQKDATSFTKLEMKLDEVERRRKEESDRRHRTEAFRVADAATQAQRKDSYRLARIMGWFAIAAAIVTPLIVLFIEILRKK